jgi:phosphoribosyl 1,2-cyclic phosphodiesterase
MVVTIDAEISEARSPSLAGSWAWNRVVGADAVEFAVTDQPSRHGIEAFRMKIIALQSGSNGNCTYVEADGVRLLLDAGISGRQAQQRLAAYGRDITDIDAVLISHDHRDHSVCMGIYARKFKLPLYVTRKTLAVARRKMELGTLARIEHFSSGETLRLGNVTIESVPTPHDAVDGVAFVVDDGRHRLGVLTDLGHIFKGLEDVLRSLDAVVLESNYDPQMLEEGFYPPPLKKRIRGPRGHLSNEESAELLSAAGSRLRWACLAHLSEENNSPRRAIRTHRRILGDGLPLHIASRYEATDVLEL